MCVHDIAVLILIIIIAITSALQMCALIGAVNTLDSIQCSLFCFTFPMGIVVWASEIEIFELRTVFYTFNYIFSMIL
jgi:hypothetical protein